jgi:hypothetical protein
MSDNTHALLGLRAEVIRDPETQLPQSISITEPGDDSLINLTLIFDLSTGSLVDAKAVAVQDEA